MGAAMRAIVANQNDAAASATISRDPRYRSMLRTTCVATMLTGGHARTRCRRRRRRTSTAAWRRDTIRPTSARGFMKAVDDTGVSFSRGPAMEHAAPSPLSPEVMGPIEKVTRDVFGPSVAVIPTMGTGATDSKYLRAVGIPGLRRLGSVRRSERRSRARQG